MNIDTKINYHEFLFYNLTQLADTTHPLKELPYDDAFPSIKSYYKEFYESLIQHAISHPETLVGSEIKTVNSILDGVLQGQGFDQYIYEFSWIPTYYTPYPIVVFRSTYRLT